MRERRRRRARAGKGCFLLSSKGEATEPQPPAAGCPRSASMRSEAGPLASSRGECPGGGSGPGKSPGSGAQLA